MYITNVKQVKHWSMDVPGAKGVKVQYLLNKDVGAGDLQLRLFTIEVGGFTPLEKHNHEHEVFILRGKAKIQSKGIETEVGVGDAIFIESLEEHQFRNIGEDELRFLCTKATS